MCIRDRAATEAENKLRQAQADYAAILAEQRELKAQTKRSAKDNRVATIGDLNEAVAMILTAIAGQPDRSAAMTNSEKAILTMRVNDAAAALEYAQKCLGVPDVEKAANRLHDARKAYKAAKAAKPRKPAAQDGVPAVEINL